MHSVKNITLIFCRSKTLEFVPTAEMLTLLVNLSKLFLLWSHLSWQLGCKTHHLKQEDLFCWYSVIEKNCLFYHLLGKKKKKKKSQEHDHRKLNLDSLFWKVNSVELGRKRETWLHSQWPLAEDAEDKKAFLCLTGGDAGAGWFTGAWNTAREATVQPLSVLRLAHRFNDGRSECFSLSASV